MNSQYTLRHKGLSFLLICSVSLLFNASGSMRSSDGATLQQLAQIQTGSDALQQAEYEVIILTAPAGLTDTVGLGVGAGQAVGTGRIAGAADPDDTHALLWLKGSRVGVDLHPSNFRFSQAFDTDGQRQVGWGNGPPTGFYQHALLWQGSANGYVDLHPTSGNWTDSIARAIAGGQQVGNINYYFQTTYERIIIEHAALWRGTAQSAVDLHPSIRGIDRSYANDTDGSRQVGYGYFDIPNDPAPYRALLWSGTAASAVVLHPHGFTHSFAEGVSGNEQVGYAFNDLQSNDYSRALLWHGTAASVVSLNPTGYSGTVAWATNGTNQVGAGGTPSSPYQSHALRWTGTAQSVLDLHQLLPAEFSQGNSIAYDIDAAGNIVGLAQRPDGSTVGVLWRKVSATPTNVAPKVRITSPTGGSQFNGSTPIQLIARAVDQDGNVALVRFFANDRLIGTVRTGSANATYQFSWRARSAGDYRIRAQATDNRGASTLSPAVKVTVVP
jgi:Bacterial Ig domain